MANSQYSDSKTNTGNTLNLFLFNRMDECIERDKLFTNGNLSREQLCRMIGVDRNRFAAIIKQYSGSRNLADYLNHKRIDYSISLMRHHPEWTLVAICESAGMSESSFKRWFKGLYGMSPSDYRKKIFPTEAHEGVKKKPLLGNNEMTRTRI
jgi:AraC-type DNA-binding domain-containing proteins